MDIVDYGNPAYDDDFEYTCNVCDKPIETEGVCSNTCFEADMR